MFLMLSPSTLTNVQVKTSSSLYHGHERIQSGRNRPYRRHELVLLALLRATEGEIMPDIIFILAVILFFVVAAFYVRFCEKL